MAEYGSNRMAVRFFRTEIPEAEALKKPTAMPAFSPMLGAFIRVARRCQAGRRHPKSLKNHSWLEKPKRKKKQTSIGKLMG
jgi:hypothetical protein